MYDLVAAMESRADAGLEGITPAPGGADGYLISGDELRVKGETDIIAALAISAAIANHVESAIEHSDDVQACRYRTTGYVRDQTGATVPPAWMRYRVPKGASITARANSGAVAQYTAMLMMLAPSGDSPELAVGHPPAGWIPPDARWIQATGVTAAVAGTWVEDVVSWVYPWNLERKYEIWGMCGHSPTGYAMRLVPRHGGTAFRPGWELADTAILQSALFARKPFLVFPGTAPPNVQKLCSSTDSTTSRYALLVREVA